MSGRDKLLNRRAAWQRRARRHARLSLSRNGDEHMSEGLEGPGAPLQLLSFLLSLHISDLTRRAEPAVFSCLLAGGEEGNCVCSLSPKFRDWQVRKMSAGMGDGQAEVDRECASGRQ